MKPITRYRLATACVLVTLGLAACTGMQQRSASTYVAPSRTSIHADADAAYMARVESVARRRGVEVVWVNVPRKPAGQRVD